MAAWRWLERWRAPSRARSLPPSGAVGPASRRRGPQQPPERLIVGLGNPGPQYELTPHNLGFLTLDRLAEEEGIRFGRREGNALVGQGEISGQPVLLAKPLSYMNRSGGPVKTLLDKYGLEAGHLLLVYDELALPWGVLRIRERGSAAGHNGVQSVITSVRSSDFARLRLGISPGHQVDDGAAFVLRPYRRGKMNELEDLLGRAADAVRSILSEGAEKAMSVFNRRAQGSTEDK